MFSSLCLFLDHGGVYEQTCILTHGGKGLKVTTGRNTGTKCTVYESKKFLSVKTGFTLIL